MGESGRRRAEPVSRRSGRADRVKGGKRAARPDDTRSIPAYVEIEPAPAPVPVPSPAPSPEVEPVEPAPLAPPSSRFLTGTFILPALSRVPRRQIALEGPSPTAVEPSHSVEASRRELLTCFSSAAVGGLLLLLGNGLDLGPHWLGAFGSLVVTVVYVWVLVARTGGRPVVFSLLAGAAGLTAIVVDRPVLTTGAAMVSAIIAAVLGMAITVPAVRQRDAYREASIAIAVAAGGAVVTVGWGPSVDLDRFTYLVLICSLGGAFTLVYRLGAGLHGLGRRGAVVVMLGGVVLLAILIYAEALRRYTDSSVLDTGLDFVRWCRTHLGAFPRPIEALLGVPALVWGTHMRARRRQGWWVCAFGVAGTAAVAVALMNPEIGLREVILSVVYALIIGLGIGAVLIRVDLALTGSGGGRRAVGRRGRRAEEREKAVRPEPKRTGALL